VAELAEVLQKPVLTIAKDLYGLVMAGHVALKGIRSGRRPELPSDLAPAPPVPVPEVVFHAPAVEPVSVPKPGLVTDPSKMAKLSAFNQRIVQTAKAALPSDYHEMVNQLYAKATQQVMQGEGPESVKNLALAISRNVVEAGGDADMVKTLNAQLKALFSK
jgi:hypothetical protein